MKRPQPVDQETSFDISELFFSKTDERGVIVSGNDVFVRVSGYSRDELLDKPHSIVRHPEMPRAVFKYFWECLDNGQPIVAYVKNLSADGRYYWVLAFATQADGGYISVRLKPSTKYFEAAKGLYAKVLEIEKAKGMDAGYQAIFTGLKELGFANYSDFAQEVLISELENRSTVLRERGTLSSGSLAAALRSYQKINAHLRELTEMNLHLSKNATEMKNAYREVQFLAVNMAVESERAGEEGRTLAVVSETFRKWAEEAQAALDRFFESIEKITANLAASGFKIGASRFQVEMVQFLLDQHAESHEIRNFASMATESLRSVGKETENLLANSKAFAASSENLRQALSALQIVCKSGRVEATRLTVSKAGFEAQLNDMAAFLKYTGERLDNIDRDNKKMLSDFSDIDLALRSLNANLQRVGS